MTQQSNATFKSIPMQGMHQTENEEFRCVQCGSSNTIPGGRAGRRKCLECNFNFDEELSKKAEQAGAIPSASEQTLREVDEPEVIYHEPGVPEKVEERLRNSSKSSHLQFSKIPRSPTYVFISKDRTKVEFATKKDVKKVALSWEENTRYDIFELVAKTSSVKVDIE